MAITTKYKSSDFYKIKKNSDGTYACELNSAALSGVAGLASITITDTIESRLALRATKIVNDTIYSKDIVVRNIVAKQRAAYQQTLISTEGGRSQ